MSREARRRLPLGQGRRQRDQLSQLRRVRRQRQDARPSPRTASVKALEGHFDPMFRSFDMDYPDAKRDRPIPRRSWPSSRRRARCPGS